MTNNVLAVAILRQPDGLNIRYPHARIGRPEAFSLRCTSVIQLAYFAARKQGQRSHQASLIITIPTSSRPKPTQPLAFRRWPNRIQPAASVAATPKPPQTA